MPNSTFIASAISILIHLALLGLLVFGVQPQGRRAKGLVSVQFIKSVQHSTSDSDPPVPRSVGFKKRKRDRKSVESKLVRPIAPSPGGAIGNPDAAKAADQYIAKVTALINQHKAFPPSAIDREEEGQVLIAVTIAKDGHILESKIESPSPFESLNQAALDAILAVGKFPELPDPTPEPIHLHVPLIFKIER